MISDVLNTAAWRIGRTVTGMLKELSKAAVEKKKEEYRELLQSGFNVTQAEVYAKLTEALRRDGFTKAKEIVGVGEMYWVEHIWEYDDKELDSHYCVVTLLYPNNYMLDHGITLHMMFGERKYRYMLSYNEIEAVSDIGELKQLLITIIDKLYRQCIDGDKSMILPDGFWGGTYDIYQLPENGLEKSDY